MPPEVFDKESILGEGSKCCRGGGGDSGGVCGGEKASRWRIFGIPLDKLYRAGSYVIAAAARLVSFVADVHDHTVPEPAKHGLEAPHGVLHASCTHISSSGLNNSAGWTAPSIMHQNLPTLKTEAFMSNQLRYHSRTRVFSVFPRARSPTMNMHRLFFSIVVAQEIQKWVMNDAISPLSASCCRVDGSVSGVVVVHNATRSVERPCAISDSYDSMSASDQMLTEDTNLFNISHMLSTSSVSIHSLLRHCSVNGNKMMNL